MIEAVLGAEDFELVVFADEILGVVEAGGGVDLVGGVFDVAGPVLEFVVAARVTKDGRRGVDAAAESSLRKVRLSMAVENFGRWVGWLQLGVQGIALGICGWFGFGFGALDQEGGGHGAG